MHHRKPADFVDESREPLANKVESRQLGNARPAFLELLVGQNARKQVARVQQTDKHGLSHVRELVPDQHGPQIVSQCGEGPRIRED
jgi:hypothetical protein